MGSPLQNLRPGLASSDETNSGVTRSGRASAVAATRTECHEEHSMIDVAPAAPSAGGGAWQRQSMEWMAAVLAAVPTVMCPSRGRAGCRSGRRTRGRGVVPERLGGVEELGAGRVTASTAVVDRWARWPTRRRAPRRRLQRHRRHRTRSPPGLLACPRSQPANGWRVSVSASSTMSVRASFLQVGVVDRMVSHRREAAR